LLHWLFVSLSVSLRFSTMRGSTLLLLVSLLLALALLSRPLQAQSDDPLVEEEDDEEVSDDDVLDDEPVAPFNGERAKIIIKKEMITPIPGLFAKERPIDVVITCTNVGKGPAYLVTIGDNMGENFEITKGSNTTIIDVLEAGERTQLNFTIVPHLEGGFSGGAAVVSYQAEGEGSRLQQAYSTGFRTFTIYSTEAYDNFSRDKTIEWTILGFGTAAAILLPLALYLTAEKKATTKKSKTKSR